MAVATHETLAYRLAEVLLKLNSGEPFDRTELADQFGVSERTIYRDLNRLSGIVDRLPDGRYQLAAAYRGKLRPKDLATFARLTGVANLFPDNSPRFLMALLDTLVQDSFLVRGQQYETLKPNDARFRDLQSAVRNKKRCWLTYADKRRKVEPYRLINNKGVWYLAAAERGKLKAFSFSRIGLLQVTQDTFTPQAEIREQIEAEDDIWFNQDKTEVLISIAPQAAYYFQRRPLLPQQKTVKDMENGGLIVSTQISHANQLLPIVRYWIPNVRVLEPSWLLDSLRKEIVAYLQ